MTITQRALPPEHHVRLGAVTDPVLGRGLAELGMLRSVERRRRRLAIEIALPFADHAHHEELRARILAEAARLPGSGDDATVTFCSMSAHERVTLGEHLRATTPAPNGSLDSGCRIYAVASGKGGVGKSTITANVAASLASQGQRVGVLDADVWGHSIPHLFGVGGNPLTVGPVMLPVLGHGVRLMSVGFFVDPEDAVVWRGPMLHKALAQFLTDTWWGELDVLLIDLPPGTGDITLSLLELIPDAALLAVTTPGSTASSVARRVVRMAVDQKMPVAGVVENMSTAVCAHCGHGTEIFGSGGGEALAELAGAPLLGHVPLDLAAREHGDRGVPVVVGDPRAASAVALAGVVQRLPVLRRSLLHRSLPLTVS